MRKIVAFVVVGLLVCTSFGITGVTTGGRNSVAKLVAEKSDISKLQNDKQNNETLPYYWGPIFRYHIDLKDVSSEYNGKSAFRINYAIFGIGHHKIEIECKYLPASVYINYDWNSTEPPWIEYNITKTTFLITAVKGSKDIVWNDDLWLFALVDMYIDGWLMGSDLIDIN
ncbi:MAG: hypothetical protein J7K62_01315 [Thermoplasmata archaeon]|nr:hypothetical protein [Thermoplasmata archaeon]